VTQPVLARAAATGALAATGKRLDGLDVASLVVAALLVALGILSLVRWLRRGFQPSGPGEAVLYAVHVTARVGMWFAFAGLFAGYALVDDPPAFRWYVMVPLALAAIQFVTAVLLAQQRPRPGGAPED
jgi:hypothetical protein